MKKLLLLFPLIFIFACIAFVFPAKNEIYAEEENPPVATTEYLTSANFTTLLTNANLSTTQTKVFILKEDISLTANDTIWEPCVFGRGITFDGNGHKITIKENLFSTINGSATIKNLGIEVVDTFNFDDSNNSQDSTNFGLLAQRAISATIDKVYVTGAFNATIKAGAYIGGLIGYTSDGTIISNSYTNVNFSVTQLSPIAPHTICGGFIGKAQQTTIRNCYAVSNTTTQINVEITSPTSATTLIIGGLVGEFSKETISLAINNFSGGNIIYNYQTADTSKIIIGKIFGALTNFKADSPISYCHTYNDQSEYQFIGQSGSYTAQFFDKKETGFFGEINHFKNVDESSQTQHYWNEFYEWDTSTVWYKTEALNYISLQIFGTFTVDIDGQSNSGSEGIECNVQVLNNENLFVTPTENSFKYGTTIKIIVFVNNDFKLYKQVDYLQKTNDLRPIAVNFTDSLKSSGSYIFTVNSQTAGAYYGIGSDISYKLKITTQDENMGVIKRGSDSMGKSVVYIDMQYNASYTFKAESKGIKYAFAKWIWVDTIGENQAKEKADELGESFSQADFDAKAKTVILGAQDSTRQANRETTIKFGINGANGSLVYLFMTPVSENSEESAEATAPKISGIPYEKDEETGTITFTIKALFSTNVSKLTVQTPLGESGYTLKVSGADISIADTKEPFADNIAVDTPLEITIEVKEGYVFNGWKTLNNLPISQYIASDETATNTTIHVTITSEFTLVADVSKLESNEIDLTFLWYILGGVVGLGLITLMVVLIVKNSKKDSFLNNY